MSEIRDSWAMSGILTKKHHQKYLVRIEKGEQKSCAFEMSFRSILFVVRSPHFVYGNYIWFNGAKAGSADIHSIKHLYLRQEHFLGSRVPLWLSMPVLV